MEELTELESKEIQDRIDNDENIQAIYGMLHRFREWNRDWDMFMKQKPKNADDFVQLLSKQFEVRVKQ